MRAIRRLLAVAVAISLTMPLLSATSHADEITLADQRVGTQCLSTGSEYSSPPPVEDVTVCVPVAFSLYVVARVPDSACQQCYAVMTPGVRVWTNPAFVSVKLRNQPVQVIPIPIPLQNMPMEPICLYTNDPFYHRPCLLVV